VGVTGLEIVGVSMDGVTGLEITGVSVDAVIALDGVEDFSTFLDKFLADRLGLSETTSGVGIDEEVSCDEVAPLNLLTF